jgi:hypothetical protein
VQALVNKAGHLRTYPFRDSLEAFFAAILMLNPDRFSLGKGPTADSEKLQ